MITALCRTSRRQIQLTSCTFSGRPASRNPFSQSNLPRAGTMNLFKPNKFPQRLDIANNSSKLEMQLDSYFAAIPHFPHVERGL